MSFELDEMDYRMLNILSEDSRVSLKELAKKANVSVPTARSRIRNFYSKGVKFTISMDSQIFGSVEAFLMLNLKIQNIDLISKVLAGMDEITEIYRTAGENDLIVKIHVPDMQTFNQLLTRKLNAISDVNQIRSNMIVEIQKKRNGIKIKPGFGLKIWCKSCGRSIISQMVKTNVGGADYFFCGESCLVTFLNKWKELEKHKPSD